MSHDDSFSRKRDRDDDSNYHRSSKRGDPRGSHGRDEEPISTLFCSGLPSNIRDRELRLLGTFLPGFEGANINRGRTPDSRDRQSADNGIIGFMKFVTQEAAVQAAQYLQGFVVDEDYPEQALRISLAKRNMNLGSRVSKAPSPYMLGGYGPSYGSYDYYGMPGAGPASSSSSISMGGRGRGDYDRFDRGSYYSGQGYGYRGGGGDPHADAQPPPPPEGQALIKAILQGEPMDTLCVRGLTPWADDKDLEKFFCRFSGYSGKQLYRQKRMAFVKFESTDQAQAVVQDVHEAKITLPGADEHTVVSVEFAKRTLNLK